jgi:hypothetical protein
VGRVSYCCLASCEQLFSSIMSRTTCTVFGLIRSGLEPTIYRTRGEHAHHYTTDVVILSRYSNQCVFVYKIIFFVGKTMFDDVHNHESYPLISFNNDFYSSIYTVFNTDKKRQTKKYQYKQM